jgi:hypothetical protein
MTSSPISYIPTFNGGAFFSLDEFHLLCHGLSKHLIRLFEKKSTNLYIIDQHCTTYPFETDGNMLKHASQDMESSRSKIPRTHFDGNWKNVLGGHARGVDRLDFVLYVVPTLLIPRLQPGRTGERIRTVMNNLIIACHLALQLEITSEEIGLIKR